MDDIPVAAETRRMTADEVHLGGLVVRAAERGLNSLVGSLLEALARLPDEDERGRARLGIEIAELLDLVVGGHLGLLRRGVKQAWRGQVHTIAIGRLASFGAGWRPGTGVVVNHNAMRALGDLPETWRGLHDHVVARGYAGGVTAETFRDVQAQVAPLHALIRAWCWNYLPISPDATVGPVGEPMPMACVVAEILSRWVMRQLLFLTDGALPALSGPVQYADRPDEAVIEGEMGTQLLELADEVARIVLEPGVVTVYHARIAYEMLELGVLAACRPGDCQTWPADLAPSMILTMGWGDAAQERGIRAIQSVRERWDAAHGTSSPGLMLRLAPMARAGKAKAVQEMLEKLSPAGERGIVFERVLRTQQHMHRPSDDRSGAREGQLFTEDEFRRAMTMREMLEVHMLYGEDAAREALRRARTSLLSLAEACQAILFERQAPAMLDFLAPQVLGHDATNREMSMRETSLDVTVDAPVQQVDIVLREFHETERFALREMPLHVTVDAPVQAGTGGKYDAGDVLAVRARTGAGIMACKRALGATGGDVERAVADLIRQGYDRVSGPENRATAAGAVFSYVHGEGRIGALVELACETDFVARTDDFRSLGRELAMHVAAAAPRYVGVSEIPESVNADQLEQERTWALTAGVADEEALAVARERLVAWWKQVCLLEQTWIRHQSNTIAVVIANAMAKLGENIVVRRFVRFEVGR